MESATDIHARVLAHLLTRVEIAPVWTEPFSHTYIENLLPSDVYDSLLAHLPPTDRYSVGPRDPHARYQSRLLIPLTAARVRRFPTRCRMVWCGVLAALTDEQLKCRVFARLAPDLMHRFGVEEGEVPDLAGYARPTLYRDLEGFGIPPHPDSLEKVVTMQMFLPADLRQLHLGTCLYRRALDSESTTAETTFTLARRFEFRPNSGYAFVVNNTPLRQSWHGCETLAPGSGVRDTLLNTFYHKQQQDYRDYLETDSN